MKILQVSFTNLNSLRGAHRVDLASGPLSDAGIFAITGPTGAGKSTILDAITLALYGRAARYGTTPSPENMMSRHTGDCQAEVVFAVNRGVFRASWHLKRARGKPDGKPQTPQRRVYDTHGAALGKIGDADGLIEELTGLNYERFLRSVLLAQGEFSRFLKAKADERASLLEQLTGTEIYSRLSILAAEEAKRRENVLEQEEAAYAAIVLLSDEERDARTREIARLSDELAAGARAHDALVERVSLGRQLQARLDEARQLEGREQTLAERRLAAAADFARLERHGQTQPFYAEVARLDASAVRAEREQQLWSLAQTAAASAADALAHAREAARLLATAAVTAHEQDLARLTRDEQGATAQLEAVRRWLDEHASEGRVETQLPVISERLTLLSEARRREGELRDRGETLRAREMAEQAKLGATQATLTQAAAVLSERHAARTEIERNLATLLEGRSAADLQGDLTRRHERKELLTRLAALRQKRDDADARERSLAAATASLADAIAGHREQAAAAQRETTARAELVESLQAQLADATRLASFEEHRASLRPGEACPLCGSAEHPFALAGTGASSVGAIEEKLARGKQEHRSAEVNRRTKEETLTRATEQHTAAAAQNAAARTERDRARDEFEAQARPAGFASAGAAEVHAALDETARSIEQGGRTIAALEGLNARHGAATRAFDEARLEVAKLEETARAAGAALALAAQERAAAAAQLAAQGAALAGHEAETALLLEAFAETVPAPGRETALRSTLENRRDAYQHQLAAVRTATSAVQDLRHARGQAETRLQQTRRDADDFPPGEIDRSTDGARVAALARQWQTLATARVRVSEAAAAETTARATEDARRQSRDEGRRLVEADTAALQAKLAAAPGLFAGLDELRAARLSELAAAAIESTRRALASEEDGLRAQRQQLTRYAAELRARQAPEGDALAAVDAERAAAKLRHEQLATEKGRVEEEIRRDDANRAAHAQRAEAITRALTQLQYWRRLRELIGSADGKKFRLFAQGLSLDLLVRHANRHLARLTHRYRLQRMAGEELDLEIVDEDQAGSTRPMASLSGGESFLTSLALALGLSDLAGRNVRIDSLFVDEGFGSLDADTLDVAVAALESLRTTNKTIGIISHVEMLKERISAQIRLEKQPGGVSTITIIG